MPKPGVFKKGFPTNLPGPGSPKSLEVIRGRLKRLSRYAITALRDVMADPKPENATARVQAAKLVLHYCLGDPPKEMQKDKAPEVLTDTERARRIEEILTRARVEQARIAAAKPTN